MPDNMAADSEGNWHYASADGERLGPVSIRELGALAARGVVRPGTLVWNPGCSDWVRAESIAHLLTAAQAAEGRPSMPVAETRETPAVEPAPVVPSAPSETIKPRKGSFVFPRLLGGLCFAGLAGAAAAVISLALENPPWIGLVVFGVTGVVVILAALTAYRKERYEIHESRLLCHRGGLMSDETTELEVRNITHVKLKLPWLRHKLFGIGNIRIESAGNAKPVVMHAIREPEAVYAGVRERMKRNGYDLTQERLLHEERPAIIGIVGECLGLLVAAVMVALFTVSASVEFRAEMDSSAVDRAVWVLIACGIVGVIVAIVLRFLDFRRRTYRVFNDVVVYEEGFLTRENAFIPYENIADANTKCSMFDRLFGLFDVQVSCQGSGSEIKFRRLRHGVALSAAIDQLVVHARQKPKPKERRPTGAAASAAVVRPRRAEPPTLPAGEILVGDFRMSPARVIVPLLILLPLFPIWVVATIQAVVRVVSTRYAVRPGSIRHAFRFLTVNEREFAYDKITGLVIKRNLWDRLFGTMTLRFWSIGSGQPIEFAHVHRSQLDLPALMRQAGIPSESAQPYEAKAAFGLPVWLRANLKHVSAVVLVMAATVVAGVRIDPLMHYLLLVPVLVGIGALIHAKLYYSRQLLRFHEHHVEAGQGVIARRQYFARYDNIKRSTTTRYPGGEHGALEIFVAGEEEVGVPQQKKGRQTALRPCSFTSGFLPDARQIGLLLDDILCGRVDVSPDAVAAEPLDVLLEAPRAAGNAVLKLVLTSVVVFPLILLLPLSIPVTLIRVKRWRYRVEAARIVLARGVFYRSETSILLDRVDSLRQSQGPLNKLFRNGDVHIMTAGSSKPDLQLVDSPAYLRLYEIIREHSREDS